MYKITIQDDNMFHKEWNFEKELWLPTVGSKKENVTLWPDFITFRKLIYRMLSNYFGRLVAELSRVLHISLKYAIFEICIFMNIEIDTHPLSQFDVCNYKLMTILRKNKNDMISPYFKVIVSYNHTNNALTMFSENGQKMKKQNFLQAQCFEKNGQIRSG